MTKLLDRLVGRTSMYRLVLNSCVLLAVVALVLSATGELAFPLVDLTVSLAVLMAATILSNALFAGMFGVRAHPESSFITAFLLWFVLLPTSDPLLLVQVALGGFVASGSKYVFAVRRRHLFNPAAFGAVWLAVLRFDVVGIWWVGTTVLVVVAAVLGVLVLHRTRHLGLGAVFVLAALVVSVVVGALQGIGPGEAIAASVWTSPLVFFAGFMLSEPLTLPPRRSQQLVVGAVVGVLFSVPISVAGYSFGPETALVIGNLLAFAFGQRGAVRLTLTGRRAVSPRAVEFVFEPRRPVRFVPGQYLELSVPAAADRRGSRRVFSIASSDRTADRLTVAMTMRADGGSSFKKALMDTAIGTELSATGIGGDFVLPRDQGRPVLLVAGGIGITPFLGQLDGLGVHHDVVVVYVQRDPADLAFLDRLDDSSARVVVVTATPAPDLPESFENVVAERLSAQQLAALVPDIARRRVYVSGPPGFVDDVARAASAVGAARVRRDHFAGY